MTSTEVRFRNATQFMLDLHSKLQTDPSRTQGINAVFVFDVDGDDPCVWTLESRDGTGSVVFGTTPTPDATIYLSAEVLIRLGTHELDGGEAFVSGLLTVQGDQSKAMFLAQIFGDP